MTASWSQDLYVKAWDFATLAHQGQTYDGPVKDQKFEYINHVGSVAMEVISALSATPEADGNLAVQCALLHDTIEDTPVTFEDIAHHFGETIALGVLALTKDENISSKQDRMADSLLRIKAQPEEIWMVKLADRITNLSEPPWHWSREKKLAYQQESVLILETLGSANHLLANRLTHRIDSYGRYLQPSCSKLPGNLEVRPATLNDVAEITEVINTAYRPSPGSGGWTHESALVGGNRVIPEQVHQAIESSRVLVAAYPSGLTGCVQIQITGREAHIGMLAVSPSVQMSGIGKRLLAEAEYHAKLNLGAEVSILLVVERRRELIEFYLRRGYTETGKLHPYPVDAGVGSPLEPATYLAELRKYL